MIPGALSIILLILIVFPVFAQSSPSKQPPPDAAALAQAIKVCKEVYGEEYAACRKDDDRQHFAARLLAKARQNDDNLAMQFALLRLARDVATQGHCGPIAMEAVDAMDEVFAVDAIAMKSAVLASLAAAGRPPSRHKYVAVQSLRLVARAVRDDNYPAASPLAELALAEAGKAHDRQLLALVKDRIAETSAEAELYEQVKAARLVLQKTPRDPAANLAVGKYCCFVKNDWERGPAKLLRGNDEALKAAAKREIAGAASSDEQVALGDVWWRLAEQEKGPAKAAYQRRAGYWYQGTLRGLSGVEADKVAKRLKEIAPLAAADNATASLVKTAAVGGMAAAQRVEGQCFEDVPWGHCRLIGFNVTTSSASQNQNGNSITSLQPIYAVGGDLLPTKTYGKPSEMAVRVLAKPGYAVGGLAAVAGDRVIGLQVIFMRLKDGRLDRTDSYASDWLGGGAPAQRVGGQAEVRLGCDGKMVVGVYGECGRELTRLGLVQAE